MTERTKYDIFISFKNRDRNGNITLDAKIGQELYLFLKKIGINIFFSDEEIVASRFTDAINQALVQSSVLFIVCTKREYLDSDWIKKEYDTFFEIKSKTTKNPQVFCICNGMVEVPPYLESVSKIDYKKSDFYRKIVAILKENNIGFKTDELPKKKPFKKSVLYAITSITLLAVSVSLYFYIPVNTFSTTLFIADESGKLLANKAVEINYRGVVKYAVTDNAGKVYFQGLPISFKEDSVSLVIVDKAKGDSLYNKKVLLKPFDTIVLRNRLENLPDTIPPSAIQTDVPVPVKKYAVSGNVYDYDDGIALSEVKIFVAGISESTETNSSGYFKASFASYPAKGEYTITYQKNGYVTKYLTYFELPKTDIIAYLTKQK